VTANTTTQGGDADSFAARDAARRREAEEEQQTARARAASFAAALLITAGLAASVWYGRTLAGGGPVPVPNASSAHGAATPSAFPSARSGAPSAGYLGGVGTAATGARGRAAYAAPSAPILPAPPTGMGAMMSERIGENAPAAADRYVAPLKELVNEINRSEVARYWHGAVSDDAAAPPATQVLTAVDAFESLTTLTTHPRRYPPELRPYASSVSLELRNYLKVTTLAVGTGERGGGDLQRAAARHLDRCNQAITRLDAAARRLASGTPLPPRENAVLH
jgi:hypothetical protein